MRAKETLETYRKHSAPEPGKQEQTAARLSTPAERIPLTIGARHRRWQARNHVRVGVSPVS